MFIYVAFLSNMAVQSASHGITRRLMKLQKSFLQELAA